MAASGMLGYGFTEEAFLNGLNLGLDLIACDAGSADPGPYYLGSGSAFVSRLAVKRDLGLMVAGGFESKIPVFIGSAGGSGSDAQVDWTLGILKEICTEKNINPNVIVLRSELNKEDLKIKIRAGRTAPLGPIDPLTEEHAEETHRVVAMMGAEPFQEAINAGADVVIAGRSSDAAIYAALPLSLGCDPGLAWHMGKIIECGAQVIEPREGQDCVIGTLFDDCFTIEPGHPDRRCTRTRVAAHTLYENPSPYKLKEPSGTLNTKSAVFEQLDERVVRVSGSKWEPSDRYTVKLEGVKQLGYRTIFIAGIRDPILVATIEDFIKSCRQRVSKDVTAIGISENSYTLDIKVYGHNAVMGENEVQAPGNSHELGILVDVIASDEDTSKAVCAKVRYSLLHTDFPGRMCISGNLAIPFSPSDLSAGEVYEFNIWHIMECDGPMEPVRIEVFDTNTIN
tara:strand:+ start:2293 stop:3651 length:1359 start_codon:yes stop_codon:yes gene_type:complete